MGQRLLGTIFSALPSMPHLLFTTTMQDKCDYPHFTDDQSEVGEVKQIAQVTDFHTNLTDPKAFFFLFNIPCSTEILAP